jgi:hypothetical protein
MSIKINKNVLNKLTENILIYSNDLEIVAWERRGDE